MDCGLRPERPTLPEPISAQFLAQFTQTSSACAVARLLGQQGHRLCPPPYTNTNGTPVTASSLADYVLHPPPRLLIGQRAPAAAHVLGEVLGVRRGRDGASNRRVREDVLEEELTPRLAVER